MIKTVTKLYRVPEDAQKALNELAGQGYQAGEINIEQQKALLDIWGLDEDTINYYQWGVSLGGILVGVQTKEDDVSKVRRILRNAESKTDNTICSSPAFKVADRMSATNPIDASMSGDFRKY